MDTTPKRETITNKITDAIGSGLKGLLSIFDGDGDKKYEVPVGMGNNGYQIIVKDGEVNYYPFKSSFVLSGNICDQISVIRKKEGLNTSANITNSPEVERTLREATIGIFFEKENIGTIMNTFENMEVASMWDVREDADYSTILLGRGHMFYSSEGVPIAYTNEYGNKNDSVSTIKFSLEYQTPITLLKDVNNKLVNDLKSSELYDSVTYTEFKEIEKEIATSNLEKNLERNGVRKFSENHFAISGYNLLFQEIEVDNNVINTVSLDGEFKYQSRPKKNSYLSIFDLEKTSNNSFIEDFRNPFMVEYKLTEPELLKYKSLAILLEYMSTFLIKQLEYCYTGKIFMKYNPRIEMGDTITLLDDSSSTYGIFRVDSFEHTLDTRGLITIANIKAVWDFKDPILDTYATKIGSELLNEFGKQIEREYVVDSNDITNNEMSPKNKVIEKIMECYLKFLTQSPKYTNLFHYMDGELLKNVSQFSDNSGIPTPVPLRFMPMIIKGKVQIPKNLKCVFFEIPDTFYTSFFKSLQYSLIIGVDNCIDAIWGFSKKSIAFIADFTLSIYTMGIHELLKPLLGITARKQIESMFGQRVDSNISEIKSMQSYNPYTGVVDKSASINLCFFNIQMRKTEDISTKEEDIDESIKLKESFVDSLIYDHAYDLVFLVELYDSFKHGDYNYKTFINNLKAPNKEEYLLLNGTNLKEYGCIVHDELNNKIEKIFTSVAPIQLSDRNVMETTIKLVPNNIKYSGYERTASGDLIYEGIRKQNPPEELKVIWFHNIHGTDEKIRKSNIDKLLKYYTEKYNSKDNEDETVHKGKRVGYIIMADCNLEIVNHDNDDENSKPSDSTGSRKNEYYKMNKDMPFKQLVKRPTTLTTKEEPISNLYDNVLISDNLENNKEIGIKVTGGRNDYAHSKNRLLISDHLPVYLKIEINNNNPR